ncbi:MAG: TIGR01777 family oxidoreductase [Proteobacteria bacterium]|nr:TIGR01777 family oxidoreductase [Pseudomonadota bacterium]MBU4294878.1 TIGR01777 family oxidoreductase [Pseudomonadota bacterium]MCG2746761.1 TIGR01777 family oxidoreductase [Desulfobulbaceae bacterium]
MKSLITGGTGFLGRHLISRLESPVVLGRNPDRISKVLTLVEARKWDPAGEIDAAVFAGVDTVYHLAGEPLFNGRWDSAKKERIMGSRVDGTRTLVSSLARLEPGRRPLTLISSSAIGYYGSRGDEMLTESSLPGNDFLASVCQRWEEEAMKAEELGIRVVTLRTGVVLDKDGGALAKMLTPFKLGLGGRLGNGRQYMSWIHINDLIGIMLHAARNQEVRGPINAVAPNPVTNREFTAALASALHRPAILPVPGCILKAAIGEFATVLLGSQRVMPDKASDTGYKFIYPLVQGAMLAAING